MKSKKEFDAVKMMRDIRDKISAETKDMSFAELKAYIKLQLQKGIPHTTTPISNTGISKAKS